MLALTGAVSRRAHGSFPSLSINRNGTIVEAHQPSRVSTKMYYQIGELNRNDVNFYEEREIVDNGKFPKVSINDDNQVVEVHRAAFSRRIFYNVGPLKNQRVEWRHRPEFLSHGRFPAVAVRGNRVVVTHDRAYVRHSTFYHVGTINPEGNAIQWGNRLQLFQDSGITRTTVAINEEFAVAAGRSWIHIVCILGRFPENREAHNIDWLNETTLDYIGICPTICLNDDSHIIMAWQSTIMRRLIYAEGKIKEEAAEQWIVDWHAQESRGYDFGCHPTIAITPDARDGCRIVEEHESNVWHTLHIHVGSIINDRQNRIGGGHEEMVENEEDAVDPEQVAVEEEPAGELNRQ